MVAAFSLAWPHEDIALLTLGVPRRQANVLSLDVLEELAQHLQLLSQRNDVAGLIIRSGKSGSFATGINVRELEARFGTSREEVIEHCQRGQQLLQQLGKMNFVTVAAIEGSCLGGGAELAAWCDRRLFAQHPRTEFGFPDVRLGLLPGWGGSVRAPRIVGFAPAVDMICTGELLDPHRALQMGWGTTVVRGDLLLGAAIDLVREEQRTRSYVTDGERWTQPMSLASTDLLLQPPTSFGLIPPGTERHYPAPAAALELMLATSAMSVEDGLAREAEMTANLFGSPVNVALVNIFSLTERNKHDPGHSQARAKPRPLRSVGIIGAGIMGAGIAAAAIESELSVFLSDANPEALEKGSRQIIDEITRDQQTGKPKADRAVKFAPLLKAISNDDQIIGADLILEAVIESISVKRELFARLESRIGPETVLASNTSTIPITHLANELAHPERFCGIHFFNPVRSARLVEIIRGVKTNDETVATGIEFAKQIGRIPVVVNDGPGFLVNRLLYPYLNEAIELILDGASIQEIDQAAMEFGMPIGPMAVYDLIGLDTAFYAGRNFWMAFPDRVNFSPFLPTLVKAGRLGQKTGRGFYSYENEKRQAEDDPSILPFIDRYRRDKRQVPQDEITQRLILVMLLEATRLIDDNIVQDVRNIDLALVYGTGFPPFRGGLLFWADMVGLPQILEWLEPLEKLGPRMQPPERLLRMAREGEKFYRSDAIGKEFSPPIAFEIVAARRTPK